MHMSDFHVHMIILCELRFFSFFGAVWGCILVREGFSIFGVHEVVGHGLVREFVEEGRHEIECAVGDEQDCSGTHVFGRRKVWVVFQIVVEFGLEDTGKVCGVSSQWKGSFGFERLMISYQWVLA